MKTFKDLYELAAPSKDYVKKKDSDEEATDYKPRSKGEEDFKNLHKISMTKNPSSEPVQHTGGTKHGNLGNEKKGEKIKKTFSKFMEAALNEVKEDVSKEKESDIDEACWVGYKQVGLKKKGKRMVPNCVPEERRLYIESISSGKLKLNSGETVSIDEKTAKAINVAMDQLNSTNKKKFQKELMKDKKSFSSVVSFAKAAE
jgi:hypothetical protein